MSTKTELSSQEQELFLGLFRFERRGQMVAAFDPEPESDVPIAVFGNWSDDGMQWWETCRHCYGPAWEKSK